MRDTTRFAAGPSRMRFNRFQRRLAILGLTMLACGAIIGAGAGPASAVTKLGGIEVQDFCIKRFGSDYRATTLAIHSGAWRCWIPNQPLTIKEVDMNLACQWQYNNSRAYAKTDTPLRHDGWYCVVD